MDEIPGITLEALQQELAELQRKSKERENALEASNQQLEAANQQLQATEQQLKASNQQLEANNKKLSATDQELRTAVLQLQETSKLSKVGGWQTDLNGNILRWTSETYRIHELSEDKVLSVADAINFYHPDDQKMVSEKVNLALEKGLEFSFEGRLITAKNNTKWVKVFGNVLMQGKQKIGLQGMIQDITERKISQEALIESESKFRNITEQNIMGVCILQDDVVKYVNEAMAKIYGYTVEEVLAWQPKEFFKLYTPETLKIVKDQAVKKQSGAPGQLVHYSVQGIKKNGELLWADNYSRTMNYNGKPADLITQVDITNLKNAEGQLKDSEAKYRSLYENAPLSYQSLDIDGNFIDVNPTWLSTLGYERDEVIGTNYGDLLHPDYQTHFEKNFPAFKKRGYVSDVQFLIRHKNGSYRYISFEGCIGTHPDGSFKQTYCVFKDITEQRQAEDELEKQNEYLSKLNKLSLELTMLSSSENIEELTTRWLRENIGAEVVTFSEYDAENKTINTKHVETAPQLLQKAIKLLGKKVLKVKTPLSQEAYDEMTKGIVGYKKSLHDVSFGEVPISISKAIGSLLNVQYFIGISYMIKGQLYGSSILGIKKDQPKIQRRILENFAFTVAVSLRRRKAEQALLVAKEEAEAKEVQLRNLTNNFVNGMIYQVRTDKEGERQFTYISDSVKKLYGCTPQQAQENADLVYGRIHPDDLPILVERENNAIKTMAPFESEVRAYTPSGEIRWIYHVSRPRKINKSLFWDGLEIDITERKQLELQLLSSKENAEERESQFRSLFNHAADAMIIAEHDTGIIVDVNQAAEEMLNKKSDEIIGQHQSTLHPPQNFELSIDTFIKHKEQLESSRASIVQNEVIRSDGSTVPVEILATLVSYNGKKCLVGTFRNISYRKQTEQALIRAKEKAEESDRLKSAFLANMSHEIRTPMNGILGFTGLLRSPELSGQKMDQYIKIIEKSGNRMLNTINDIVDISRIEAGQMEVQNSEISVNSTLKEIYDFFLVEANDKGIELIYSPSLTAQESTVITDQHKLEGILTNLIKNALKHTEKGSITIGCNINKKNSTLEFYVKDTGIGIARGRISAIFNRFEQADIEDSRALQGSGLGLAISKSYAEMLGGEINVSSEEGLGSNFTFSIPTSNELNMLETRASRKKGKALSLYDMTMLVAEDDMTSQQYLSALLTDKLKDIIFAENGLSAIQQLQKHPEVDIILMDIKMPILNGYDATREIRKFNPDVIIIAQTAFGLSGDRKKALDVGCDEYISKPIIKADLLAKIGLCIDKKRS